LRATIKPQLARHHAGDVCALDEMQQDVLPVRGAIAQLAEQRDQLRVHVGDTEVDQRVLARAHTQTLDLDLAALVLRLDAMRVDAPVEDKLFESEAPDFSSYRLEAGEQYGFWRVVDDEVHAGHRLEATDVAALTADDPALHLIARQVQHGDRRLGGLLTRHPLDRQRHDLAGAHLAFGSRFGLDVTHQPRGVSLGLRLDHRDELGLGLRPAQPRDPLEFMAHIRLSNNRPDRGLTTPEQRHQHGEQDEDTDQGADEDGRHATRPLSEPTRG
jgi:hypothetical protein